MISALLLSGLLGAAPPAPLTPPSLRELQRRFLADGEALVSTTGTHRVVAFPDGTLELQGAQPLTVRLRSVQRARGPACQATATGTGLAEAGQGVVTQRACGVTERWLNHPRGLEHSFTLERPPEGSGDLLLTLAVTGPWHHQDAQGHLFAGPGAANGVRYGQAFLVRPGGKVPLEVNRVPGGLRLRVPRALVDAPGAFPLTIDPLVSAEVPLEPLSTGGRTPAPESQPAVALDAQGRALVVWTDSRRRAGTNIFGARVATNGVLDDFGLALVVEPGSQSAPAVCWDGSTFVLAWQHTPADGALPVIRTRTYLDGLLGPITQLASGRAPALSGVPAGGFCKLAWVDPPFISAGLLSNGNLTGVVQASTASYEATDVAIASDGATSALAWVIDAGTRSEVWSNFGSAPRRLSSPSRNASRPTLALQGGAPANEVLVYWDEVDALSKDVVGANLGASGTITPRPTWSGRAPALFRASSSTTASTSLGWLEGDSLQLVNLSSPTAVGLNMLSQSPEDLVIASGPQPYAAWVEPLTGDISGAFLGSGTVSDQPQVLTRADVSQQLPRVALSAGANDGLAVWVENDRTIKGARLTLAAGGPQLSVPFHVLVNAGVVERLRLVAGPPGKFLVAWRERLNGQGVIRAQVLGTNATSGTVVELETQAAEGPAAAWDAARASYRVAWIRDPGRTLQTRDVMPSGTPDGTTQLATTDLASDVELACLSGACLLAWQGLAAQAVKARLLDLAAPSPATVTLAGARPFLAHDGARFFLGFFSNGLTVATVEPGGTMSQPLRFIAASNPGAVITQAAMAPGQPPVLVYAEQGVPDGPLVTVRLDLVDPPQRVGQGSAPVLATASPGATPVAALVFTRFEAPRGAVRAFALSLAFSADGGVDGGVDAGLDGGLPDAGAPDAGGPPDAGAPPADAGVQPLDPNYIAGCGCEATSAGAGWLLLLLFARSRRRWRR